MILIVPSSLETVHDAVQVLYLFTALSSIEDQAKTAERERERERERKYTENVQYSVQYTSLLLYLMLVMSYWGTR
jgi:hypothetical protein